MPAPEAPIAFELGLVALPEWSYPSLVQILEEVGERAIDQLAAGRTHPRDVIWHCDALPGISRSSRNFHFAAVMLAWAAFLPPELSFHRDALLGDLCVTEVLLLTESEARLAVADPDAFRAATVEGAIDLLDFGRGGRQR